MKMFTWPGFEKCSPVRRGWVGCSDFGQEATPLPTVWLRVAAAQPPHLPQATSCLSPASLFQPGGDAWKHDSWLQMMGAGADGFSVPLRGGPVSGHCHRLPFLCSPVCSGRTLRTPWPWRAAAPDGFWLRSKGRFPALSFCQAHRTGREQMFYPTEQRQRASRFQG